MEFTGERFIPGEVTSPIYYEHAHRYLFARRFATDRRVLDIGCGDGYGSALLAQRAASVVGMDVSADAIDHARSRYGRDRLTYEVASAERIPFPDRSFDLIVAFEVIEHIPDPLALLAEARRLLAPGGVFLVSSPNKRVYSDIPGYQNPYHVKEFYLDEFRAALSERFHEVRMLGQRLVLGSLLWDIRPDASVTDLASIAGGREIPDCAGEVSEDDVVYALAICSDESLDTLPAAFGELLLDRNEFVVRALEAHVADMMGHMRAKDEHIADMTGHMQAKDAHIADMMGHMRAKDAHIEELRGHLHDREREIEELREAVIRRDRELVPLRYQVGRLGAELGDVHHSPWYRLARSFRIYRPRAFAPFQEVEPLVSIVLVNFNGLRYLAPCLDSLRQQTYPRDRLEILLIDNASTDGSAAFVRENYPEVRVLEAGRNLGFAGGNNLGFGHAQGAFVALLNNDTVVEPGWLAALVAALGRNPRVGTVSSKIYFQSQPGIINNVGLNLYLDGSGGDRGFHQPDEGQFDDEADVFGACGASMLIRRDLLDDVGWFDERFFMYYEDLDLAWRARIRGWESRYEPGSVVHHVHCGSSQEWSPFFVFHVERNRVLCNVKNASARRALRALASFGYRVLRKWLLVLTLRERSADDRGQAVALARAALSLCWELPGALWKRLKIRGWRRMVPDRTFDRLIAPNP